MWCEDLITATCPVLHLLNNDDLSLQVKADQLDVLSMQFLAAMMPFGQSTHNYPHLLAAQLRRFLRYLSVSIILNFV